MAHTFNKGGDDDDKKKKPEEENMDLIEAGQYSDEGKREASDDEGVEAVKG